MSNVAPAQGSLQAFLNSGEFDCYACPGRVIRPELLGVPAINDPPVYDPNDASFWGAAISHRIGMAVSYGYSARKASPREPALCCASTPMC